MDLISAVTVCATAYKAMNGGSTPKDAFGDPKVSELFVTQGSITKLMSDFIVEPLLVISEDAMDNGSITDKMTNIMLDIFTGYYLQAFTVLNNIYNIDAKTIINVLATDNGFKSLKSKAGGSLGAVGSTIAAVSESAISNSYMELLGLTNESANKYENTIKLLDNKNGILGNSLLTRNIVINIDIKKSGGSAVVHKIEIPITIKARLIKATIQNIIDVSEPNKKHGNLVTWLDYTAGLSTFWDYAFQTKAVAKYKKNRLGGNEFLEILNSRKLSAASKLVSTNIMGYELNYNLLILTDNDKNKIERALNLNIYKEATKDMFLDSVNALTCAVMSEDYEQVSLLTPDIRGISTISYKEIKSMNNKSNNDLTDLVKAIFANKNLF